MFKRIAVVLALLALLALAPAPAVLAAPGPAILIDGLSYTIMAPTPERLRNIKGGLAFAARGEATIDCNGVAACQNAGLHGGNLTLRQAFLLGITLRQARQIHRNDGQITIPIRTAGRLEPPGEVSPLAFRGRGEGTLECLAGTCTLSMELSAKTRRGLLTTRPVAIDIDHSSAGIVAASMTGDGEFKPGQ
jgi:hypothetical protein